MIELPEASVLADQLNRELRGKVIKYAKAANHPHKFAWYSGAPEDYNNRLTGARVVGSYPEASRVFIELDNGLALIFGEGTRISFLAPGRDIPRKHQLMIEFKSGWCLVVSIQMYGFILLEKLGEITNKYIVGSIEKPSPMTDEFDRKYFDNLFDSHKEANLSTKAFLATEQRIPGLGNGVLQDILFNALIHPRLRLRDYTDDDKDNLFNSIKVTLKDMADKGGRNTETDIYGRKGGYTTIMSRLTTGNLCPACGGLIEKQSYLGGSVYVCPACQRKE